jgi:formate dehydrogenase iron-sulfur subunit
MAQQTDIFPPPGEAMEPPGAFEAQPMGFYTDTTVCIAARRASRLQEWNGLSARDGGAQPMSGDSYDNTRTLDGEHWRHVKFIEQFSEDRSQGRWLMMSDVCKHCVQAGCLEVCPTNAIIRTSSTHRRHPGRRLQRLPRLHRRLPVGVIEVKPVNNTAMKCTLCYDRMQNGWCPPAPRPARPPRSSSARSPSCGKLGAARVEQLNTPVARRRPRRTPTSTAPTTRSSAASTRSYLLIDEPEVYGLPRAPKLPSSQLPATTAADRRRRRRPRPTRPARLPQAADGRLAAEARADAAGAGTAPESVRLAPGETVVVEPDAGRREGSAVSIDRRRPSRGSWRRRRSRPTPS